ncbi:hypothetical protein ATS72_001710 [Pseudoalteromonas sp. 13-15]|jgi:hypothetical protein|nr:hypothetical protein ATS72_001710 [Pseudoalteromonas sp. 13-15]
MDMDFHTKLKNAEFWFTQASQMFEASKALFNSMTSKDSSDELRVGAHKGSLFLLGIATENAFKGVLAFKEELKIENERLKPITPKGVSPHDLEWLSEKIGHTFSEKEIELFKRLSVYTIWAGKYGTPLKKSEFLKDKGALFQSESDYDVISDVISRLKIEAGFNKNSGWPSLRS